MNELLTELQQFFGAYFNQDWSEDYSSADEVVDAFLLESSIDVIITVGQEVLDLINSCKSEPDLQERLLYEYSCYYYYPNEWASGLLWLNHVAKKIDGHLLVALK
jgi:hypothetical protein